MKKRCTKCGMTFTTMSHVKTHPVVENGPVLGYIHTADVGVFRCGTAPEPKVVHCGPLEEVGGRKACEL